MRKCARCNTAVNWNRNFCPFCGGNVVTVAVPVSETPPEEKVESFAPLYQETEPDLVPVSSVEEASEIVVSVSKLDEEPKQPESGEFLKLFPDAAPSGDELSENLNAVQDEAAPPSAPEPGANKANKYEDLDESGFQIVGRDDGVPTVARKSQDDDEFAGAFSKLGEEPTLQTKPEAAASAAPAPSDDGGARELSLDDIASPLAAAPPASDEELGIKRVGYGAPDTPLPGYDPDGGMPQKPKADDDEPPVSEFLRMFPHAAPGRSELEDQFRRTDE